MWPVKGNHRDLLATVGFGGGRRGVRDGVGRKKKALPDDPYHEKEGPIIRMQQRQKNRVGKQGGNSGPGPRRWVVEGKSLKTILES